MMTPAFGRFRLMPNAHRSLPVKACRDPATHLSLFLLSIPVSCSFSQSLLLSVWKERLIDRSGEQNCFCFPFSLCFMTTKRIVPLSALVLVVAPSACFSRSLRTHTTHTPRVPTGGCRVRRKSMWIRWNRMDERTKN